MKDANWRDATRGRRRKKDARECGQRRVGVAAPRRAVPRREAGGAANRKVASPQLENEAKAKNKKEERIGTPRRAETRSARLGLGPDRMPKSSE